jgi:nicotinamidase-related amidase
MNSALLLIDVQEGFHDSYWGPRNNPMAEEKIARLLAAWRRANKPVIHIQHESSNPSSPLAPQQPGFGFMPIAVPKAGESVFQKRVNSAFIGTPLEAHLRSREISSLVIAGFTTDHCVSTTTRMAANLGFEVFLISDATATFDKSGPDGKVYSADDVHAISLASLHGEFATVFDANAAINRVYSGPQ